VAGLAEAAAVGVMGAILGTLVGIAASLVYLVVFYTAAVEGAGFGMPTWASVSNGVATGLCQRAVDCAVRFGARARS